MKNLYQTIEDPEENKKFYIGLDDENKSHSINLEEFVRKNMQKLTEDDIAYDEEKFFLLKEITQEDNLIGFISYDIIEEFNDNNILVLNKIHMKKGYKDYSHIINDIVETTFSLGFQIIIKNPTRNLVESLIDAEFAHRINNKLVYSEIAFMSDTVSLDTAINNTLDEITIDKTNTAYSLSFLYDLDLCAVITLSPYPEKIYTNQRLNADNQDDYCSISIALKEDDMEYNCIKKRKKDKLLKNKEYFMEINKILTEYENKQKK